MMLIKQKDKEHCNGCRFLEFTKKMDMVNLNPYCILLECTIQKNIGHDKIKRPNECKIFGRIRL